jgi:hypothetical protein
MIGTSMIKRGLWRSSSAPSFLSLLGQLLVWRERNDRNFNDQERTLEELKSSFFFSLFTWTTACLIPLVISFYDFLVLFSLCS